MTPAWLPDDMHVDARRVPGLVSEKVLDHTVLCLALIQLGCDRVPMISCSR